MEYILGSILKFQDKIHIENWEEYWKTTIGEYLDDLYENLRMNSAIFTWNNFGRNAWRNFWNSEIIYSINLRRNQRKICERSLSKKSKESMEKNLRIIPSTTQEEFPEKIGAMSYKNKKKILTWSPDEFANVSSIPCKNFWGNIWMGSGTNSWKFSGVLSERCVWGIP